MDPVPTATTIANDRVRPRLHSADRDTMNNTAGTIALRRMVKARTRQALASLMAGES